MSQIAFSRSRICTSILGFGAELGEMVYYAYYGGARRDEVNLIEV